ncbi:hypothetical protein FOA43_002955 [Brettanomyces nanus]|uniref:Uncharacterized protein n=1 Tax=Eeniella nana TaxID=13502 RepID=A0A875S3R4_EENNA|nr:uncharacterized protein FOA43_002955 [Brettanomyces nanus]QPG75598.1 hypothetical protein FOA43_002955 [Brettanomyces nanus]
MFTLFFQFNVVRMVRTHGIKHVAIVSVCVLVVFAFVLRMGSMSPSIEQVLRDVPNLYTKEGEEQEGENKEGGVTNEETTVKKDGRYDGLAALGFSYKKSNEQLDLARKLNEMTQKLVDEQEKRINKLEKERFNLEKQLNTLRRPSESLSLREKLAYLYPYDANKRFPGYIWQSWRYGLNDDRFGPEFKMGEEAWARSNPGFVHEIFNDDTSNAFVHCLFINVPEVIEAYEALPDIVLKVDFFRYLILFSKGGIWADIDTFPVKPVPNWIPENVEPSELGMIIGADHDMEGDGNNEDWQNKRARKFQFSNAVIQAKSGHPVLRDIIAEITETTLDKKRREDLNLPEDGREIAIMNWTGEGIWTDVVLKFFNDYVLSGVFTKVTWKNFHELDVPKLVSDVLVMPKKVFGSPFKYKKGKESDNGDDSDPLVFVRHQRSKVYQG